MRATIEDVVPTHVGVNLEALPFPAPFPLVVVPTHVGVNRVYPSPTG